MDTQTAWVLVVLIIASGFTISAVVELFNPQPHHPLNKFDAIDKELKRLHSQAEDAISIRPAIYEQIGVLNKHLTETAENESVKE